MAGETIITVVGNLTADPEIRTDFGISREVTHHSDNRFACHRYLLTLQLIVLQLEKLGITYLRRIFVRMTDSFRFSRRSSSSLVAGSAE